MAVYPNEDIVRAAEGAPAVCARISFVEPFSPADDAGFEPDCLVTHVDGQPVRDIIDWRWLTADDVIELGYVDLDGEAGTVELEREEGQDWGFSFDGVVFDGVHQCRNACTFCFMRQLPAGMRPSLTLRDDDFRLSFLSGTFVTLTNLSAEDEARILEQRISPLRVSLHAVGEDVRRALIGRHAAHGLAALDRLLAAGIEVHAQIVLVPGVNDGDALAETLEWAYARPGVLNVGIVPLGYTSHQEHFTRSFNEPDAARGVIEAIESFQRRAMTERETSWVFAADEFYRNAYGDTLLENLPLTSHYGDFSMFEDGIGIIRSYVDDFRAAHAEGLAERFATALDEGGVDCVRFVVGQAMEPFMSQLISECGLEGKLAPLVVPNRFFGGNVDVTGLLTGRDIACAVKSALLDRPERGAECSVLKQASLGETAHWAVSVAAELRAEHTAPRSDLPEGLLERAQDRLSTGYPAPSEGCHPVLFVIPSVVFNDDGVTLDDMSVADVEKAAGARVAVVSCNPSDFLSEIIDLIK